VSDRLEWVNHCNAKSIDHNRSHLGLKSFHELAPKTGGKCL
jgi:hypothetical protein